MSPTRTIAGRNAPWPVRVTVRIGDRSTRTDCVVGPPSTEVLVGQIILEALDLIADCTNGTLMPRTPGYPLLNLL